jgi:hypothetical protein
MTNEPDFYISAFTELALALLLVFVGYNVLTQEQADLWFAVIKTVIIIVVPVIMGAVARNYTTARAQVRIAELQFLNR